MTTRRAAQRARGHARDGVAPALRTAAWSSTLEPRRHGVVKSGQRPPSGPRRAGMRTAQDFAGARSGSVAWFASGGPSSGVSSISLPEMRVRRSASQVLGGQVGGQLDEREVRPDRRCARSPGGPGRPRWRWRRRSGAARPCAACRPRSGTSPAGRRRRAARAAALAALGRCGRRASAPRRRALVDAAGALGLGVEQQRLVALEHDGQRGGHVDLGHVVLADVVGDDVAEERRSASARQRLR